MKIGVTAGATQATGCFRRSCSAWRVSCRTLLLSHVPGAGPVTLGWRTRPTRMFFVSTTRVCQVCAPGPLTKAAPKGLLPSRCLELLSFVFSRGHGSCFYPALEGPAWGQEDAHVDHLDGDPFPTAPQPWADDVGCTGPSRSLRVEPCSELSSDRISSRRWPVRWVTLPHPRSWLSVGRHRVLLSVKGPAPFDPSYGSAFISWGVGSHTRPPCKTDRLHRVSRVCHFHADV